MPNNPRPAWHRRYGVNSQQARLPFTDGGMQLITTPQRSERDGKKGTTKRTSKASSSLARVGVLAVLAVLGLLVNGTRPLSPSPPGTRRGYDWHPRTD